MNELQRQAYMEAMGVDSYAPRLVLPGAKASQLCEMPVVESFQGHEIAGVSISGNHDLVNKVSVSEQSPEKQKGQVVSERANAMKMLLDNQQPEAAQVVKRGEVALTVDGQSSIRQQEIPHFALTIVRGANILIVDSGVSESTQSSDYLRLLHDLLLALGVPCEKLLLDPFIWPMVKNSKVDQTELAARQTLNAFLSKQIAQLKVVGVIAMGDKATHYLNSTNTSQGVLIDHQELTAQMICTRSAIMSLEDPSLKPIIWQDLQPLRMELNSPV